MTAGRRMVISIALLVLVVGAWQHFRSASLRAQGQLLSFRESLTIGLTQKEVERRFESGQYSDLTLHRLDDLWLVETPRVFGALNWNLHLFFEDKSLARISVRSLDVPIERAPGAPPDIERR